MFDGIELSFPAYLADSILSGIYGTDILQPRFHKKTTLLLWVIIYFGMNILMFEVFGLESNIVGVFVNFLFMFVLQSILFKWNYTRQIFVAVSFLAGRSILKYIRSVLYNLLSGYTLNILEKLLTMNTQITVRQADLIVNIQMIVLSFINTVVYVPILWFYLKKIGRTVFCNGYEPEIIESLFLIFPCVTAICLSVTLRILILRIDDGNTVLVYDSVPEVQFWIVLVCIFLLVTIILTMILFRYLVDYNEENRKLVILQKQVEQLHREIEDIENIYSDLRGLKHDMRNHLNNILNYVNRHGNTNTKEIDGYISQIEEAVAQLDISSKSGNAITDIIIYQRQQEAKKQNLRFDVDFVFPKELAIDIYDVAVILNNALDNAFEASRKLDDEPNISLRSYMKGTLFFIEIKNEYMEKITLDKETGLPYTNKKNKKLHGIGIENIRKCAEKYMGDIDIELYSEGGRKFFSLTVMLCSRISLQK